MKALKAETKQMKENQAGNLLNITSETKPEKKNENTRLVTKHFTDGHYPSGNFIRLMVSNRAGHFRVT